MRLRIPKRPLESLQFLSALSPPQHHLEPRPHRGALIRGQVGAVVLGAIVRTKLEGRFTKAWCRSIDAP